MKVIIAGGRNTHNMLYLEQGLVWANFLIDEVVSGGATGVDRLGERWARAHHVPVTVFEADWAGHGRAAGPIRNREMAEYASALVAIWDGQSVGTKNMIEEARKAGLVVVIYYPPTIYNAHMGSWEKTTPLPETNDESP